jgi:hypothetical protein
MNPRNGPVGSNTYIGSKIRVYYCRYTTILYLAFIIATYLILVGNLVESKVEDSGLCL